jgi:hypothetical protein
MSDAAFISKYIAEASIGGKNPVDVAKIEIETINQTLNDAEKLKLRKMKLISVLDHLGDDTYKRRRASATPSSDDIDTSSDDNKELIKNILIVVEQSGPLLVRDLIRKVGGYDQDTLIMRAVKFLGEQDILSRDSDMRVQKGNNWEKRDLI